MSFIRHKKFIIALTSFFFMSLLFIGWHLYHTINAPLLSNSSTPIIITLDRSTTAAQFVHLLEEKKLIKSRKAFMGLIRYHNLAHRLKAGVYQINPGETPKEFLNKVVAGDVLRIHFKIIEGTTLKKVSEDLTHAPYVHYDSTIWNSIKQTHPSAEGLLLADTYQYSGGADSSELITKANANLTSYLNESWLKRDANIPYKNSYELLIAASIIEKETAVAQERRIISGVLVNRLKKGMPLQMDPTVIYALGDHYKGVLSHEDLSFVSPYNTYRNRGLPPTPIAMVGKEAIDAAAHPQLSNYLYYVARGDGAHQFSETYKEQKHAINQYRRTKGS